jgi:hypothetical protein
MMCFNGRQQVKRSTACAKMLPLKLEGYPRRIARAVRFLCNESSSASG